MILYEESGGSDPFCDENYLLQPSVGLCRYYQYLESFRNYLNAMWQFSGRGRNKRMPPPT